MLAARKVKMSGSETKMERGNIDDFFRGMQSASVVPKMDF